MSAALVGYEHFLGIAARIGWGADTIDLSGDAAAWSRLGLARRNRLAAFVGAFALAEERVAVDLEPFIAAAPGQALADCFRAQARDEARHARFFERYTREVIGAGDLRARVAPEFAAIFEQRLREAARTLASGALGLADAVALYHLVLEGVVFSAGQNALLAELRGCGELPGLREGLERIVADERWHIGLGVRVLSDQRPAAIPAAERAIGAWGNLLRPAQRDAALWLHRRRLAVARLSRPTPQTSVLSPLATATS